MKNQKLIDALAQLSPEEALEVMSQVATKKQEIRNRPEIPSAKIEALKDRHRSLLEISEIQFPVKIEGQVRVGVEWDTVGHSYLRGATLILSDTSINGEYFKDILEEGDVDYNNFALEQLKPLVEKGERLIEDIISLAEEYRADPDNLVEVITDDILPRWFKRSRKNPRRRKGLR